MSTYESLRAQIEAHEAEETRLLAEVDALRARTEAAEADLSALAATVGAAVVASALAPGESLSAPPQHIIVSQVNRLRTRAEAAEQRAEALAAELAQARADQAEASGFLAECHKQLDELEGILSDTLAARARAEAEAERLRSAIAETLRLADIYAGVAAHNAEAEPETAGEAWRSAGAATVRELRRALGGAA